MVPLTDDEESDDEVRRARALLKYYNTVKRKAKAARKTGRVTATTKSERVTKLQLRRAKGAANYTPCLPCLRSLLRGPRGHCHKNLLEGHHRCYECVTRQRTYVRPPVELQIHADTVL